MKYNGDMNLRGKGRKILDNFYMHYSLKLSCTIFFLQNIGCRQYLKKHQYCQGVYRP